jgi:hypothetical protein
MLILHPYPAKVPFVHSYIMEHINAISGRLAGLIDARSAYIMDAQYGQDKTVPQYFELAEGQAVTVPAVPGTEIHSVEGEVWVTQEGDAQDYFVPTGANYNAASNGSIVVSALAGHSRVAVYRVAPQPAGLWAQNAVHVEPASIDVIRRKALEARGEYFAELIHGAWKLLQKAWCRLLKLHNSTDTRLRTRGYNC